MKPAQQRRQEGIARQRAENQEQNNQNLANAKLKNGIWTFSLVGHSSTWMQTAQRMVKALADREAVTVESLNVCVMLPEHGRTYAKPTGTTTIYSQG